MTGAPDKADSVPPAQPPAGPADLAPRGPWSFMASACAGGCSRWGLQLTAAWVAFSLLSNVLWALHLSRLTGWSSLPNYWGELLTATARTRGAVGAVVDGFHRDTPKVLEQNWPVFSRGRYAQDSSVRTAVVDFRCPIEIGGVWIEPGDLIFGDLDGVVVVPRAVEAQVITGALEKARGEKVVRQAIEDGMSATAAFKKFGIL